MLAADLEASKKYEGKEKKKDKYLDTSKALYIASLSWIILFYGRKT